MHPKAMTFQLTTTMKILLGEIPALSHHSSDNTKKRRSYQNNKLLPQTVFYAFNNVRWHDPN